MLYARRSRTHPPFRECEYNNDLLRAALVTLRSDVALDMGAAWHWRKEQGPGGSGFANRRAAVRVAQPGDPSRRRRTCWIAPRFCISGISWILNLYRLLKGSQGAVLDISCSARIGWPSDGSV